MIRLKEVQYRDLAINAMDIKSLFSVSERVAHGPLVNNPTAGVWKNWDRAAVIRFARVAFVMCLAIGLRLWGLNQIGFNTDEAVYSGQAAAIAQAPILKDIFPVFRAHPLLFQFSLALGSVI